MDILLVLLASSISAYNPNTKAPSGLTTLRGFHLGGHVGPPPTILHDPFSIPYTTTLTNFPFATMIFFANSAGVV